MLTKQLRELERQADVIENAKIVRTSEIFKILTIPSLGKYSGGDKFLKGTDLFFKKVNGKYKAVPVEMDYTMILNYVGDNWIVQVANSEDYENLYLSALLVKDKNKGIGTELMNKILDHCDENNYKCFLHPFPLEYSGNKYHQKKALLGFLRLRDWYKLFGFVEQTDGYMVYHPQNNLEI
jgi:GNAT superfamily N-acetyltransferase